MDDLEYTFEELVDIQALSRILDNLYKTAEIPSAIIDMKGKILAGTGWQRICLDFHRKNPEAEKKCIKSDTYLADEITSGKPYAIYECPHGMVDSCCPVIIEGHHVANVFTGQMLHTPLNKETFDRFRNQAQLYGFDETDYLDALSEVPIFPFNKHKSILELLSLLAEQIAQMGLNNLRTQKQKKSVEESEELYRSLFQDNHSIMLIIDPASGDIVDANQAACNFYGYSMDEITNKKIFDINLGSQEKILQEMEKLKHEGRKYFNFQHRLAAGQVKDVEVYSGSIIRNGKKHLFSIIHDITKRKQSEELLRKASLEWATAMDASEDAIYLLDSNRHILRANKIFYLMTGSTPQTAIGRHITDIVHQQGKAVPCPVCCAQEEMCDAIVIMEPDNPDNPAGRPIEVTIKVVKDESDQPISILMRLHDLTEQRKLENILRKKEKEWEHTFDSMSDIITIQDKNMRIVKANKAAHEIFQLESGGLDGKFCYEIFRGVGHPCHNCPGFETLKKTTTHGANITHENLGKIFHVTCSPILDENEEFTHLLHIARDITDQKKMEKTIYEAQKMESIGNIAGGIAHDFGKVLIPAFHATSTLSKLFPEFGKEQELIQQVSRSVYKANDIVRQILSFSRPTPNKTERIRIQREIEEVLTLIRSSIPQNISIEKNIQTDCAPVLGSAIQINQIVLNLITNGYQAIGTEKGTISIRLEEKHLREYEVFDTNLTPGKYVYLEFADTGPGIPRNIINRIFEPYFTTKPKGEGTGLGLTVVYGLVKGHGGHIGVQSNTGKGAHFSIYLPACNPSIQANSEHTADLSIGKSENPAGSLSYIQQSRVTPDKIEGIKALSPEIRKELKVMVLEGDMTGFHDILNRQKHFDSDIIEKLHTLAKDFDYKALLKVLSKTGNNEGAGGHKE